jgi:predicted nuclease of restriction endonuclease-like (RecB) superfamily
VKTRSTQRKKSAVARASQGAGRSDYRAWSGGIAALLAEARRQSARSVNAILTATYWEIGRRIVEFQQQGEQRAEYGDILLKRLSADLAKRFGRGFGWRNLFQMRGFYLTHQDILSTLSAKSAATAILQTLSAISFPPALDVQAAVSPQSGKLQTASAKSAETKKVQTLSGQSSGALIRQTPSAELEICQTVSDKFLPPIYATASRKSEIDLALYLEALCHAFPLSWSHYVRLLSVEQPEARKFYETESLRGGWSVRQLDRQVSTLFYERTALAKNKAKLLTTGAKARPEDAVSVEEEIKSPYILEFLNLRDDHAENDLEDALVRHLEAFLLELGNDFTFVARQKRIRVGKQWYRIDLLLFHRRLRCLFIFDLKLGRFTHADAGQMNLYVNYAGEHLTLAGENPPAGLILCSEHDEAVARYSMGNVTNKILAAQYKLALPDPRLIEKEIEKTRRMLESPARRMHKNI